MDKDNIPANSTDDTSTNDGVVIEDGETKIMYKRENPDDKSVEGESTEKDESNTDDKTTDIPDQYKGKTIEEVIKMNQEAQKKITELSMNKSKDSENTDINDVLDNLDGDKTDENTDDKSKERVGEVDFNKIREEFLKSADKEIPEDVMKQLKASGQAEFLIDNFTKGIIQEKEVIAKSTQDFVKSLYEKTNGEDGFKELMKTVKEKLGNEEIESFKQVFSSGNKNSINRLMDSYVKEFPMESKNEDKSDDKDINGSSTTTNSGDVFKSRQEYHAALNSFKYKSDPSFKKEVDAKAAKSNWRWD